MNRALDSLIDVTILILCAAIGLSVTVGALTLIQGSRSIGQAERATVQALGNNPPPEPVFDAVDLTVLMTTQDRFMQVPTRLDFYVVSDNRYFDKDSSLYHNHSLAGSPVKTVDIDDTWFPDRESNINTLWNGVLKKYATASPPEQVMDIYPDDTGGHFRWCVILPKR
jgi:hypothetical protein